MIWVAVGKRGHSHLMREGSGTFVCGRSSEGFLALKGDEHRCASCVRISEAKESNDTKVCEACGNKITRGKMNNAAWIKRRYCCKECQVKGSSKRWNDRIHKTEEWAQKTRSDA